MPAEVPDDMKNQKINIGQGGNVFSALWIYLIAYAGISKNKICVEKAEEAFVL